MSADLTFVFADLAGYTALTEAHGDDDAAHVATRFHELAKSCLPAGTRLVKTIGDAVMLVAETEAQGIEAATAIARAVHDQPSFPALRVGIHAGPAVERDGDYFGSTVNVAARVSAVARGGEIVCTERVAAVASGRALAAARPIGTVRLKNVPTPLALFELSTDKQPRALRHIDPVCRMQVVPLDAKAQTVYQGTTLYFCSQSCADKFAEDPETHVPRM
jgi:adenylate cyclase